MRVPGLTKMSEISKQVFGVGSKFIFSVCRLTPLYAGPHRKRNSLLIFCYDSLRFNTVKNNYTNITSFLPIIFGLSYGSLRFISIYVDFQGTIGFDSVYFPLPG